jgi:hypothetical protein
VNNPLHIGKKKEKEKKRKKKKEKKTYSLLNSGSAAPFLLSVIAGPSTVMTAALFLDHNRKSNFHHPL